MQDIYNMYLCILVLLQLIQSVCKYSRHATAVTDLSSSCQAVGTSRNNNPSSFNSKFSRGFTTPPPPPTTNLE